MKTYLLTFKLLALGVAAIQPLAASAQTSIADPRTGCRIRMISVGDSPPTVRWDGPCVAGFASGVGTVVFDSGIRYTGEMRDGWRNGQGKISFPDGNSYEGAFINSRFNGRGLYVFSNGQRIEGQFKDGDANGACEITLPNRTRISGQCVEGEIVGQGSAVFPDGGRYDGGYVGGQQSGQGVYVGPNRQFRQEGTFREGKFVSGRAYIADDSYQNIENGRPVGDMVPSPAAQARMLLNVLATAAAAKQGGNATASNSAGSGNSATGPLAGQNAQGEYCVRERDAYLQSSKNLAAQNNGISMNMPIADQLERVTYDHKDLNKRIKSTRAQFKADNQRALNKKLESLAYYKNLAASGSEKPVSRLVALVAATSIEMDICALREIINSDR